MGYQRFNARMFGENFNELEMRDSIKYAHANNVKVYLTLNTLIRDDEIGLARQMVFQAIRDHVDGILIQDIGLAAEIQKKPDLSSCMLVRKCPYPIIMEFRYYMRWDLAE